MNVSIPSSDPVGIPQPRSRLVRHEADRSIGRAPPRRAGVSGWIAGLICLLFGAFPAFAHQNPPGCSGSGLGIDLFSNVGDVHIEDTIRYSVRIFNSPFPACDATGIKAEVVTPDGITNSITGLLRRTALVPGESDYYTNVVSYVVRAQDLRPDGTVRATAQDNGDIHQNDTNSRGGGNQGVNTEVNLPCVLITAVCVGSVGENGAITFTGSVTNCGNSTLVGLTVTNFVNGTAFSVLFPTNLAVGQSTTFGGSWVPLNPCLPSTAVLTVRARDEFTATPQVITNLTTITCQNVVTSGIKVTKTCPVLPVSPGQLLNFTGSVSNTGNTTLTNIIVVNDRPAANTVVFSLPSLAPGEVATFTGAYVAPANCSVSDTLTATAMSRCGVPAISTATATCTILTTPQVTVTAVCPATPLIPGGNLTYTGTVKNTGNITLTNVVVVNDQPVPNTPVFNVALLAPGASANFTRVFTAPANACTITTVFSGSGRDICTASPVTSSASTVCTVITAPAVVVTLACPAVSGAVGAPISYTGTVRNSGNVTLNNVFVVNSNPAANTPVIGPITLAAGATVNFVATFTAPPDVCPVTSTVIATGNDACTGTTVTHSATATCPLTTAAAIVLTQTCPVSPAVAGGLFTYTGTVRNSGNITLTNVVVVNNLSGATPIFTAATLAPGETAAFTGSYVSAFGCATTSISTVTGRSVCGVAVTHTATATCPLLTTPAILVTQTCPTTPVLQCGILTYSGTVKNTGNITLTNIVVMSDHPATNAVVFTWATLAPGASAAFTGSYKVPTNYCVVSSTVKAHGQGCEGVTVSDSATKTCIVQTLPKIVVTKICPPGELHPGDLLVYSGTVSNAGNITLINVSVSNNHSPNDPPLRGPITLAPGEWVDYTGSYIIPENTCGTDTVTATGLDVCTFMPVVGSVVTTCPVITPPPGISVTKNCPVLPTPKGGLYTFSGTVSNTGLVTLVNVYVVDNQPTNNTPVIGPITLAPGASMDFTGSYIAPRCCCFIIDTLTARGQSRCTAENVSDTATAVCPLLTTPAIALVQACPATPLLMGSVHQFSGYVTNTGDAVLTNVFVFGPGGANAIVLGPIELAPGESESYSGSYTVPFNTCSVDVTTSGRDACRGALFTGVVSCPVATTASIAVSETCPAGPVAAGNPVVFSGWVTNTGNITLIGVQVFSSQTASGTLVLGPISLAPGASAPFTGTYPSTGGGLAPANTVTAIGTESCLNRTVSAGANCLGPVPALAIPNVGTPVLLNGILSVEIRTEVGKTHSVEYKNHLGDPTWITLDTILGTGGNLIIRDSTAGKNPSRFYRVTSTPQ